MFTEVRTLLQRAIQNCRLADRRQNTATIVSGANDSPNGFQGRQVGNEESAPSRSLDKTCSHEIIEEH